MCFVLSPLTLHVPRPPNAIAEPVAIVLDHTNVTKMFPLGLDKNTTAASAREEERERERERMNTRTEGLRMDGWRGEGERGGYKFMH